MEQPPSYVDQTHPNLVCRLKKALYSLKQAPRAWSNKIGQYLVTSGFQTSNANFSLYVKKTDHGIVVIVIYVDDLIIIGDSDADISDLKKLLKQKFEMKDLGELRYFFGIKVIKSPKGIWLLQRQYALNKLSEYGMTSCKPILIPLEQNVKLSADEGNLMEDTTMYRCIVGSLIHDHHKASFELCSWSGESIHANTTKATFGCSEAHTEVHKTYLAVRNFL
jgi:hypothetical protein